MNNDLFHESCVAPHPVDDAALHVNYVDRVNVGFAALTMKDLAFSPAVYWFLARRVLPRYSAFQIPPI